MDLAVDEIKILYLNTKWCFRQEWIVPKDDPMDDGAKRSLRCLHGTAIGTCHDRQGSHPESLGTLMGFVGHLKAALR